MRRCRHDNSFCGSRKLVSEYVPTPCPGTHLTPLAHQQEEAEAERIEAERKAREEAERQRKLDEIAEKMRLKEEEIERKKVGGLVCTGLR